MVKRYIADDVSLNAVSLGELKGWRAWRIDFKNLQLQSPAFKYIWTPGINEAEIPTEDNIFGFYSLNTYQQVIDYTSVFNLNSPFCLGIIEVWGEVIQGELGSRAQFASVHSLASIYFEWYDSIVHGHKIKPKLIFDNNNDIINDLREKYALTPWSRETIMNIDTSFI
jgi:hypothetical protein